MTTSESSPDSLGEKYQRQKLEAWAHLDYDRENVPVTDNFDMNRVIGRANLREDAHGLRVDVYITDPEFRRRFLEPTLDHFSVSSGHIIRDKEKERRLPWQQKSAE